MTDLDKKIVFYRVEVNGQFFAAYSDGDEAARMAARLRKQGMDAVVVSVPAAGAKAAES